jgi:hypothetical protein
MYYIINQNDQIVAIDPQLLTQLNIPSADEFYKKVALKEITFELDEEGVRISVDGNIKHYTAQTSPLAGMLGDIRLVDIDMHSAKEEAGEEAQDDTALSLDDIDLFGIKEESDDLTPEKSEPENTDTLKIEDAQPSEEDELFELILPTDAENAIAEIDNNEPEERESTQVEEEIQQKPVTQEMPKDENSPIYIDVERISERIGISPEDYNLFLNEYIDTALTFEQALQSNDQKEKAEALQTLSHLSNVLHLPFVGDILNQIKNASLSERDAAIESFFATLGRLTTSHFEEEKPLLEEESSTQEGEPSESRRPSIDLSNVKPIHFDFQLEEAAKDLSLPVELIEEFVNDFITQAHEETEKMLAAYEKGDLETVQKIGHLLKGTSSNLRINALSDTLYEIQFNEDIDRVPELVKNYWAHFLSLENQIELISKK